MKKILLSFFISIMLIACSQKTVSVREVWTKEQANEWYQQWGWLRGCDFIPSTKILVTTFLQERDNSTGITRSQ